MNDIVRARVDATDRYLMLIDISGYTSFLTGVERTHGEDFSAGLPAGYRVLGELLQGVIDGLAPQFELVKVEGDAVFGTAPSASLDGKGPEVVDHLAKLYRTFIAQRDALRSASDDLCLACTAVETLDLKMIIHRGLAVGQTLAGVNDLVGPAVNVAHRLLKNSVRERIGYRPYVLITEVAASVLGIADIGFAHPELYPDVGTINARVVDLGEIAGLGSIATVSGPISAEPLPEIQFPMP